MISIIIVCPEMKFIVSSDEYSKTEVFDSIFFNQGILMECQPTPLSPTIQATSEMVSNCFYNSLIRSFNVNFKSNFIVFFWKRTLEQ